jgi:hypothetical protein
MTEDSCRWPVVSRVKGKSSSPFDSLRSLTAGPPLLAALVDRMTEEDVYSENARLGFTIAEVLCRFRDPHFKAEVMDGNHQG